MSANKAAITVLLPREDVERPWICLFELSSLVISDPTGKGDFHGDVDAVREKNMEDPHRRSTRARLRSGGRWRRLSASRAGPRPGRRTRCGHRSVD
jgi:hypothetical protein